MEEQQIKSWFALDGDNTLNLSHNLNEDSVVMDLGAYRGKWLYDLLKRNPALAKGKVYAIEPVPAFFDTLPKNLIEYPNVQSRMVGVGLENKTLGIQQTNDATSTSSSGNLDIELVTMENILKHWNLDHVDLLQINIEGLEYELLENWIKTGLIKKFKALQIQFHFTPIGPKDSDERKKNIQESLKKLGYTCKFNFNYVWEHWELK